MRQNEVESQTQDQNIENEEPIQETSQPLPEEVTGREDATTQVKKMPLALRKLLPYNKPGRQGLAGEKCVRFMSV